MKILIVGHKFLNILTTIGVEQEILREFQSSLHHKLFVFTHKKIIEQRELLTTLGRWEPMSKREEFFISLTYELMIAGETKVD